MCSLHFTVEDYEDRLQAELLGTCPKKLKKTAIPSLNLPRQSPSKSERSTQCIKNENGSEFVKEILHQSISDTYQIEARSIFNTSKPNYGELVQKCEFLEYKNQTFIKENKLLQNNVMSLVEENDMLQNKNENLEKNLVEFEQKIVILQTYIRELEGQIKPNACAFKL